MGSPTRALALVWLLAGAIAACGGGEAARDRYLSDSFREVMPGAPGFSPAQAEELAREASERGALTLSDCFRLALSHSYRLKMRGERVVQADTAEREAIAALLPTVSAHGQFIQAPEEFQILINEIPKTRLEFYFKANQTLFDAGAWAALDVTEESRRIEILRLADERDQLLFEVASSFYRVLGLERDLEALKAKLERAREKLRVVEVRERAGDARREELLYARARLEEAEANAIDLEGKIARERSRLSRLVGVAPLDHTLEDTYEVEWSPGELPQLVEAARDRADLEIARRELERTKAQKKQVRGEYLPTAYFEGIYWGRRQDLEEDITWTAAIYADWILYDGGGREARYKRARSAVRRAELEVERRQADLRHEIEDALIAFRSLDQMTEMLETWLEAADQALERSATALEAGTGTELQHLRAKEVRVDAERDLARARFARTLALLRIRLVIGDLRAVLAEEP